MQLVLGKNTLEMNEFTGNECLPNLDIFRKFEETTHPQKYARKRIVIDFERVSFVCALERLTKYKTFGFAQVALAMRFKKNSLPDEWIFL